ncbi:[NiFe]-hydrogenase assembly chaperone HybE [Vibrio algarum]|uniref:[NiFe]-hydrogenase assembly chaperone HybE n=1 Tax=Vibrio algarum TaxID=3020714 RepID=A0ABT4YLH7_9VIBR|nr:[NiFe]-hydrogenase assembly chaperone HybE [Vibrio sp. KJ40-1]MDB1122375.1 [NiFe]-hydrogenase assembly chaperone HybE [Vibrio sp. KJ40-1]
MNVPLNFTENPTDVLEIVFNDIHANQMHELPFVNKKLKVKAVGFSLYESDWLGVLLTPWTLSIILIPGPNRVWQSRTVGDKIGIRLPSGDYSFTYGAHEQLGNYLASSIMSPLQDMKNQAVAVQLAKDLRQLITAIPTEEVHVPDPSRRSLFGLRNKATA